MSDDFRAGMFRPLQYFSKLTISEENIRLLVVCISILGKVPNLMNDSYPNERDLVKSC